MGTVRGRPGGRILWWGTWAGPHPAPDALFQLMNPASEAWCPDCRRIRGPLGFPGISSGFTYVVVEILGPCHRLMLIVLLLTVIFNEEHRIPRAL